MWSELLLSISFLNSAGSAIEYMRGAGITNAESYLKTCVTLLRNLGDESFMSSDVMFVALEYSKHGVSFNPTTTLYSIGNTLIESRESYRACKL